MNKTTIDDHLRYAVSPFMNRYLDIDSKSNNKPDKTKVYFGGRVKRYDR